MCSSVLLLKVICSGHTHFQERQGDAFHKSHRYKFPSFSMEDDFNFSFMFHPNIIIDQHEYNSTVMT